MFFHTSVHLFVSNIGFRIRAVSHFVQVPSLLLRNSEDVWDILRAWCMSYVHKEFIIFTLHMQK